MRILGLIAALFLWAGAASAQSVTVIGPVTPGNCSKFFSTTQIQDAGSTCGSGGGGGSPAGPTNAVQTNAGSGNFGGDASFTYLGNGAAALGVPGAFQGSLQFGNTVSGSVTLQPVNSALGSTVLQLPAPNTTTTLTTFIDLANALPSLTTNQIYGGSGAAGTAQAINIGSGLSYNSGTQTLSATGGGGGSNGISFKRDYLSSVNPSGSNQYEAQFTASGSGTNLTVSAVSAGTIQVGATIAGSGVPANTYIVSQTSGTIGGTGVYITSASTTSSGASLTAIGFVTSASPVTLFLPAIPASATNLLVYFDGVDQAGYTWNVTTQTLTLSGGIPASTQVIEVVGITLSGSGAGGNNCDVQYNNLGGFGGQDSLCATFSPTSANLALGIAGTSVGSETFKNVTSGSVVIQPVTGALGTTVLQLPAPNTTDTFALLAATQTFTNKALTSPAIIGGSINNTTIGATTPTTGQFTTVALGTGALTLSSGDLGFTRLLSPSGAAPGSVGVKFEWACGTAAGSVKLLIYAGTSTTPTTFIDSVGSGVSGC